MRVIPDRSKSKNRYILGYSYVDAHRTIPLLPEEVVWFRYFNPLDEYAGLSPLAPARLSLDMGKNALKFNASFFKNNAIPQDLIFFVNGASPEEIEDFYKRLEKRMQSPSKAHRPFVWDLSQGAKPERLGLTQRDMEFIAALNFTVEDAARVWGIPPPKLYSQVASVYNNVRQADIEFYTDTISGEWKFLETEVTELLIPQMGMGEDLYAAFDLSHILPLQEALAEQYARERADVAQGILTVNEVRRHRGLEPVSWGDTWWMPFSSIPADEPQAALPNNNAANGRAIIQKSLVRASSRNDRAANLFARRHDSYATTLQRFQNDLFNAQKGRVLDAVSKAVELDIIGETQTFTHAGLPRFISIFSAAMSQHATDFGLVSPPVADRVLAWITARVDFWSNSVNTETGKLLLDEIVEGTGLGESIKDLQLRVEKVFQFNSSIRSERIARTESLALANQGHLAVYEANNIQSKTWLTAMDERTREAHAAAHDQTVALNDRFYVGGEYMDAPGLGSIAANNIACRCSCAPGPIQRSVNGLVTKGATKS